MLANPNNIARAVFYARVSSEEQREGQTIDSQINELEQLVQQRDWHLTRVYKDEGWTGSILARPDLDRLRDDASKGLFDLVLVNDVDRLARDVTNLGIIKRDLERHGVRLIFKKLPDENSPTHNLMVNILGSFAEFERQMIADRTRRGTRYKVEVRKQYLGSYPPYGFRYVPKDRPTGKDGYLEIIPEEAAVIRNMFTWVDREGLSARKVTDRLTQLRIRSRKREQGWGRSSVLRILHCEMYAGIWHYNKHKSCEPFKPRNDTRYRTPKSSRRLRPRSEWLAVPLHDHLRIVDHNQWDRVQKRLAENAAFSPRNSKHTYLLKSLIRCGGCSRPYVGDPGHGKFYYRCLNRCGKQPTIREEILNEVVWDAIVEAMVNPKLIEKQLAELGHRNTLQAIKTESDSHEIITSLDQLKLEEDRLLEAYRLGILSATLLGEELEKVNARRAPLEERRTALSRQNTRPDISAIKRSLNSYCEEAANRVTRFTYLERQQFLRLLIKSIIFEGDMIRIRSLIPIYPDRSRHNGTFHRELSSANAVSQDDEASRIVPTMINHDGRNPTDNYKGFSAEESDEKPEFFEFTIEKPIVSGKESKFWLNQKRGPDSRYQASDTQASCILEHPYDKGSDEDLRLS